MIRPAIAAATGAAVGYLAQSFFFSTFDITSWSEMGRGIGLIFMVAGGGMGFLVGMADQERDNG
jgi:hypothetical protein